MSISWANPLGHNIIATRCCRSCGNKEIRTLWSRPWEFACESFAACLEETPLTMPEVAAMLSDAPFKCRQCDGPKARLVAISVDERSIPF